MKSITNIFRLILAALIVFSFTACPDDSGSQPVKNKAIDGLWWCWGLISHGGDGKTGLQAAPGMWVFNYPNFWRLSYNGTAAKGTYTISGEIKNGEASGSFIASVSRVKLNGGAWEEVPLKEVKPWSLKKGAEGKMELFINEFAFPFEKAEMDFIREPSAEYNGSWLTRIGDPDLNDLVSSLIIMPPMSNTAIDGLWWNQDLIKNGDNGNPGVWAFIYPDFWNLNNLNTANKGTFTINGKADMEGISAGTLTTATSGNNTGGTWAGINPPNSGKANITLSADGRTLIIGITEFTKISWYATANNTENNGPWQDKIDDQDLYDAMPPMPGWNAVTSTFTFPPFIEQPNAASILEYNNTSLTRDLFANLVSGATEFPARWGPKDGYGEAARLINIRSNGIGGSRLSLRVLRSAQYLVFRLGPGFTGFNKEFVVQWYGDSTVREQSNSGSTAWHYLLSPTITSGSSSFNISYGLANGLYWDEANRLMIIDFAKALPEYNVFAGENSGTLKIDDPAYDINKGSIIINLGFRANMGVFRDDWDVQNVYLVNIVD